MSFDGSEGGSISVSDAANLTAAWRSSNPSESKAAFMGRDIIDSILAQDGCVGIRTYFAQNENEEMTIVMVGVDANENDMTNLVADFAILCPSTCDATSPLN